MQDGKEKKPGDPEGTLDYQEPVLVRLDDREKSQLGMCGVGVTGGPTACSLGSGAVSCSVGGAG
jgi:hypothetical protein